MNRLISARADPETTRAYWTMSRRDSERAFRSARRHSRLVRLVRMAIPASVAICIVVYSMIAWFNPMRVLTALPVGIGDLVVSGTKITMEQPRMSGFTKDQRAYAFTADAAAQDLTKPNIVELRKIRGKIEMQDKSTIEMTAATGVYDTKSEMLKLKDDILLTSSTGKKGRLSEATIDVKKGNVVSDKPVELEMMQGVLGANRLEIIDSGDLVRFLGGVEMTLMMNGKPLPATGGMTR